MKAKARAMPFDFLKGLAVFSPGRVVQRAWPVWSKAVVDPALVSLGTALISIWRK